MLVIQHLLDQVTARRFLSCLSLVVGGERLQLLALNAAALRFGQKCNMLGSFTLLMHFYAICHSVYKPLNPSQPIRVSYTIQTELTYSIDPLHRFKC